MDSDLPIASSIEAVDANTSLVEYWADPDLSGSLEALPAQPSLLLGANTSLVEYWADPGLSRSLALPAQPSLFNLQQDSGAASGTK